uniref:Transmembrane protein n=1 Tax=Cucumis sativus TaxID=3659 RepID=A0A0A0KK16_CUCSA
MKNQEQTLIKVKGGRGPKKRAKKAQYFGRCYPSLSHSRVKSNLSSLPFSILKDGPMSPFPCLNTNPRFLISNTMSLPFQSLSLTSPSPSSSTFCFSTFLSRNPCVSLPFPPSRFPNTLHFQILDYKFRSPFNFGSINAHHFCPRVSTSGGVGRRPGGVADFDIDSLLSATEFFCLVASLIGSVGFALNCAKTRSKSLFLAVFGDGVLVGTILFLVAGVAIGAWIRRRQWNRVFRETAKGVLEVNLMEKTNKLEEDLRSSATLIRVLSRQLEKLGIRFRVTRKALKKPVEETAALAQKTSEATRALAVRGDILEKELAEIQKVLLAMQEQQQKQLDLILAIGNSGKMWESRQEHSGGQSHVGRHDLIDEHLNGKEVQDV